MKNGNRWRLKCGENDMYLLCGQELRDCDEMIRPYKTANPRYEYLSRPCD